MTDTWKLPEHPHRGAKFFRRRCSFIVGHARHPRRQFLQLPGVLNERFTGRRATLAAAQTTTPRCRMIKYGMNELRALRRWMLARPTSKHKLPSAQ